MKKTVDNLVRMRRPAALRKRRLRRPPLSPQTLLLLLILLILGVGQNLEAQTCTLICKNPSPSAPLQLAIDQSCQARIFTDLIVTVTPQTCSGDKVLVLRDSTDAFIAQGTNEIMQDFSAYIGQVVSVTIRDMGTGAFCTSYLEIVDNLPPQFGSCQDTVIACTADTSVASLGRPMVTDNCGGPVELTYRDSVEVPDCNSSGTLLITRIWTARDRSGNTSVCTQSIVLDRPSLIQVVFPQDVNLNCNDLNADTSRTGIPLIMGAPITEGDRCGLEVSYVDDTTQTCGGATFTIVRNWRVRQSCNGQEITHSQVIRFEDNIPPVIAPLNDLIVRTNSGSCDATVFLPDPMITDNCDGMATYVVTTSYGAVGVGPHRNVPIGLHFIQYTAMDRCGNSSNLTIRLTVVDEEPPVAVCDQSTTVSLTDGGVAIVAARAFDNGSSDNCKSTVYFKTKRMERGACNNLNGDDSPLNGYQEWFDDYIFFCCDDVGEEQVQALLRVYEVDPGQGPVDPIREQPGGDLFNKYNECMFRVRLQDKIPPRITCPPDTTIDCADDLEQLGRFGAPQVFDNCVARLDSSVTDDLSNCGQGTLSRTFTVYDISGNSATCTQTITVENLHPLQASMITWPQDYETTVCGAGTDPEDLPAGYGKPVVEYGSCALVASNHKDVRFDVAQPACYKIIRTWTVIDWCLYDPDKSATEGRFEQSQVIKVSDNDAPVLEVPADTSAGVGSSCDAVFIQLAAAKATDCSRDVIITNDSPYADNNGANASGRYPVGVTIVTFTAKDRCGNVTTKTTRIVVNDTKAPSPVCIVGLSVNLGELDNGEILARIAAGTFDGSSSDNCYGDDIKITVRRADTGNIPVEAPTAEYIDFTCADIGNQLVEVWVTDPAGNSDYCVTYVSVQDNQKLCPQKTETGMIAGAIQTREGENIEDVTVELTNADALSVLTGTNGLYQIIGIPFGIDYTIEPKKNDDLLNGVSTIDLIMISRHIRGVDPFDSPYQYLAADVDRSGKISTLDLIRLRKIILNQTTEMPNGNASWRFVDAGYEFPAGVDPLSVEAPERKRISNFFAPAEADFVGVKVGDVNGSAQPNQVAAATSRTTYGDLILKMENREFQAGEEVEVVLWSDNLFNLLGFQFTLDFDERLLEIIDVQEGGLPGMSSENIGLIDPVEGLITASWNDPEGIMVEETAALLRLKFRARREGDLTTALQLVERPTPGEAYNYNQELWQVILQVIDDAGNPVLEGAPRLYQNYPNPFNSATAIGFAVPKRQEVQLTVHDFSGRLLYTHSATYDKGYHELQLQRRDLDASNLLYYTFKTGDFVATRKMVLTAIK